MNQDLYERFHVFNSLGSTFPNPGGVDGGKWQPLLKVYQRRKEVGSKAQTLIWHSLDDNGLNWGSYIIQYGFKLESIFQKSNYGSSQWL